MILFQDLFALELAWFGLEAENRATRGEFKRLMGTAERLGFEAAGKDFLPEELSAHALGSLLADAEAALIQEPGIAKLSHGNLRQVRSFLT